MEHIETSSSERADVKLAPGRTVLPIREVVRRIGLSRSTIYELIRRGEFPAPIQLTPNRVGWLSEEVDAWLVSRPRGCQSDRR